MKAVCPSVFIVHQGKADYLDLSLKYSIRFGHKTYLIGSEDCYSESCDGLIQDNYHCPEFELFKKSYIHYSSNTEEFELLCFRRYFYLLDSIKKFDIKNFWMIDSDVLLLDSLAGYQNFLEGEGYDCSLSIEEGQENGYKWSASPHISYWTRDSLGSFVEFLGGFYTEELKNIIEKYEHHKVHGISGGICDMTALYLWSRNQGKIDSNLLAHRKGFGYFDHNINQQGNISSEQVEMLPQLSVKKIYSIKGKSYLSMVDGLKIQLTCLHFQGGAKQYMKILDLSNELALGSLFFPILKKIIKRFINTQTLQLFRDRKS